MRLVPAASSPATFLLFAPHPAHAQILETYLPDVTLAD